MAIDEQLQTLIKACLLRPWDDLPRMILADYCDERTDYDTTILRKPEGHWIIRVRGTLKCWPDAVTYHVTRHLTNGLSRIFPADVIRIWVKPYCRCRDCYCVCWCPAAEGDRDKPTGFWQCLTCYRSRHTSVVKAIKMVGREALV